jgi:two-component system cell cycle sensor histidine kinase/response regulator CckA
VIAPVVVGLPAGRGSQAIADAPDAIRMWSTIDGGVFEPRTRVLLVDDELDEFIICRDLLVRAGAPGYTLQWARTFEAGLDMLEHDQPAVCLVDYQLGLRSGLDFVRVARLTGVAAEIPLIVMTGRGDRGIDADSVEAGAADYLDKLDLTPAQLERSIRHALDRAATSRELRASERRLAHAERVDALDRLAGHLAHDFNNLITVMRGCLDLLQDEETDAAERVAILETLRTTADRANELTRDLLDLRGQSRVEARDLDLGPFVEGLRDTIQQLVGSEIELEIAAVDGSALVRIDPKRLELAILNLAANARDAMPAGGRLVIGLEVTDGTRSFRAGDPWRTGSVAITVRDTGHGMTEESRAHAFEPYFSTKERGRGTGLGLASVHGTVVDGRGEIAIESAPGAGTTVRIRLPRVNPVRR